LSKSLKKTGFASSTLRYYEERGLIQSTGRHGLRRLFDCSVLEKLALISLGRSAGLTLDEIGTMFTSDGPKIDRALLAAKADEIDRKIHQLTAMRDGLRHAVACKAATHFECPKFQRLLGLAGKHQLIAKKSV
jgi:DNA-binding transcriptional MerR regulator